MYFEIKSIKPYFFKEAVSNLILRLSEVVFPVCIISVLLLNKSLDVYGNIASYFTYYFLFIFIINFGTDIGAANLFNLKFSANEIVKTTFILRLTIALCCSILFFFVFKDLNIPTYVVALISIEGILNTRFLLVNTQSLYKLILPTLLFRFFHLVTIVLLIKKIDEVTYIVLYALFGIIISLQIWVANSSLSAKINFFKTGINRTRLIEILKIDLHFFLLSIMNYFLLRGHLIFGASVLDKTSFALLELADRAVTMFKVPVNAFSEVYLPRKVFNFKRTSFNFLKLILSFGIVIVSFSLLLLLVQHYYPYAPIGLIHLLWNFIFLFVMFALESYSNLVHLPYFVARNMGKYLSLTSFFSLIFMFLVLFFCFILFDFFYSAFYFIPSLAVLIFMREKIMKSNGS